HVPLGSAVRTSRRTIGSTEIAAANAVNAPPRSNNKSRFAIMALPPGEFSLSRRGRRACRAFGATNHHAHAECRGHNEPDADHCRQGVPRSASGSASAAIPAKTANQRLGGQTTRTQLRRRSPCDDGPVGSRVAVVNFRLYLTD